MKTDLNSLHFLQKEFYRRWNIQLNIYEDEFHRTDCWFKWKGQKYDVEVKKRRFDSSKYPTAIINLSKYKYLIRKNAILVYCYDDKWGICKNLGSAFVQISQMYAPTTTDWVGHYEYSNKVELNLDCFKWYAYQ